MEKTANRLLFAAIACFIAFLINLWAQALFAAEPKLAPFTADMRVRCIIHIMPYGSFELDGLRLDRENYALCGRVGCTSGWYVDFTEDAKKRNIHWIMPKTVRVVNSNSCLYLHGLEKK